MTLHKKRLPVVPLVVALFICLIGQTSVHAQRQPVSMAAPLIGDSVKTGKTLALQDTVYYNPSLSSSIAATKGIDNIVSLTINEFLDNALPPDSFHVVVRINVSYTTTGGVSSSRLDTLTVFYSKNVPYDNKAVKLYQNFRSINVEILDVAITAATATAVRPRLRMDNMMVINRHFVTDCSAVPSISFNADSVVSERELLVSWPAVDFIPAYDLEWTFIDKAALDSNNYNTGGSLDPLLIFKNNASRVTIAGNSYKIPLLYDGDGTVFFRVRTTQSAPDGEVIAGAWSSELGTIGLGEYDFTGHERDLNWQATTSFAEEGKRKSVVQYYDGSLKARQTVTKDNTTQTTVVAETLYDKQGRPVIQVLPSPTLSKLIAYTPLFNQKGDVTPDEYDKSLYDTLISPDDYCETGAPAMGKANGASQYYSPSNPLLSVPQPDYHRFVPDAGKYPFTETRYTRDNTGRIDRQGGVGVTFQIGSGHETQYFYSSANQKELDVLFGTEAGDASHYEKNMVRDANGQFSVSYVDMHGRTVATALAGDSGINLDRLPSYDSVTQTDNLLTPVNNIIKDNHIQASKSIPVPASDYYTFNYSLSPESLSLEDCKDSTICYDCLYDLTVTISDNCNNQQFGGSPVVIKRSNFSLFKADSVTHNLDTTCAAANIITIDTTIYLEKGSYDVTKTLSISKEGMQYYRDSIFIPHSTCRTFNEFMLEMLDSIRQNLDCTPDEAITNLVIAYKEQMMADLTPLSGQYADTAAKGNCFSIFIKKDDQYLYQSSRVGRYFDENGNPDFSVKSLPPEEFIGNFQDNWAETLLPLHPEYRLWVEYEKLISAYNWEADFFNTQTYAQAVSKGFLNPTGSTSAPASQFTVSGKTDSLFYALGIHDPAAVNTAKNAIDQALFQYVSKGGGQYLNLWGISTGIVKCTEDNNESCFNNWNQSGNVFDTTQLCTADLDMAWRVFRSQYLLIREDWIDAYARQKSGVYPSMIGDSCLAVFPDRNIATSTAGYDYGNYNGTSTDTTTAKDNLDSYLYANCEAFAKKWWEQLAPCGYSSADSLVIIPKLIQVAYEGADAQHPFGASTVKPSSTHTDRSFEEVINEYNAVHYPAINPVTCNAYLITDPKPYDHPGMIVNLPIIAAPDSCACTRINELYYQFAVDSAAYQNFSNYMLQTRGTRISQGALDTLRNLCNTTDASCKYLEKPILLPPALQCGSNNACADCESVKALKDSFDHKFPGQVAVYADTSDAQRVTNKLFASYFNYHLGFNKTAQQYLDFLGGCRTDCDSLKDIVKDFKQYYFAVRPGGVYKNLKLSPATYALTDAMNALIRARLNPVSPSLPVGFGIAPFTTSFTAKLRSIIKTTTSPSDSGFHAIVPLPLDYTLISVTIPELEANTVFAQDFVTGTASAYDLSMKYYSLVTRDRNRYFQNIWSYDNYGAFGFYGVSRPAYKYLPDSTVSDNHSHYTTWFTAAPDVDTEPEFTTLLNAVGTSAGSGFDHANIIPANEIKAIKNVRLVPQFFPTNFTTTTYTLRPNAIAATLELRNGTDTTAYLFANFGGTVYVKYKETIDSNLYNSDCQKAFAYYFNQRTSSHYTYQQIDSLYSATCGSSLDACSPTTFSCDSSKWTVYNPGTNLQINSDLYANSTNNIPPVGQFFTGGHFNAPSSGQAAHYVLVNKKDSINAGSATLIMQWRVKPDSMHKSINPFIRRGSQATYVGAQWIKDPADTAWWIGATILKGGDGDMIGGMGLQSNSPGLLADWVKITNPSTGTMLYFNDFTDAANCAGYSSGPFLCGDQAMDSIIVLNMDPCADTLNSAIQGAGYLFDLYQQKLKSGFEKAYMAKCLDAGKIETFTVTHPLSEYHYTLYYYDQAGNLVKTVPPEGVHHIRRDSWFDSVNVARNAGDELTPPHTLLTTYRYNSLNQVITQHSPDRGFSRFWYDRLGRLVVSQNAKQLADTNYSYTLYDELGRITEVGQKRQVTAMTDGIARNQSSLNSWLDYTYTLDGNTVIADQVTSTVYDQKDELLGGMVSGLGYIINESFQKAYTLRNRVSFTRYYDKLKWNGEVKVVSDYDNSTTYSYDIHGNVDTLVHDYQTGMMVNHGANRFKAMAYRYDLISGKVNEVHYQPGMADEFYHRYEYDAENRLTNAYTSDRKALIGIQGLEEHEAFYQYYKHGPVARTVLGQEQVQGVDYAYTLQGWLKGVNSDSLLDGDGTSAAVPAKDAYRFSLNYFNGDYAAISSSFAGAFPGYSAYMESVEAGNFKPLYNGNISSMVVGIPKLGETKLYNYRYDQLNRIVRMDTWRGLAPGETNPWSGIAKTDEYKERISYDANGNILKYLRNGNNGQLDMDNLTYQYPKDADGYILNNRLRYVHDQISDGNYPDDINSQTSLTLGQVQAEKQSELITDNYQYDAIGNLTKDEKEGVDNIEWTVYGKIKKIIKSDGTEIVYTYDVAGNRLSKEIKVGEVITTTWYARDAQGNVMAVYSGSNTELLLNEQYIFGSSRLGVWKRSLDMNEVAIPNVYTFTRASKLFELSNHLGSVLVTISDKKLGVDQNEDGTVDYYNADVIIANDMYPFGSLMPGRTYNTSNAADYRYGFNGKENDNEVKGKGNQIAFEARIYDPRLGKFLSTDPLERTYPWQSTYVFAHNNPIKLIDVLGMGGGDPTPVYHRTSSDNAASISQSGFDPGKSNRNGFTYFSTTPEVGSIGTAAASGNTIVNATVDISSAKAITKQQMTGWFNEGLSEANKQLNTKYSSMAEVPKELKPKYQSIADGVRNTKLADFMKADGGAIYNIAGKNTIAVAESAISSVKITGISGPGAAEAIKAMSRPSLNGESAKALAQYGKASTTIKWGGRACIAIAVSSDIYEIYQSDNTMRTITKKVGGWMGATVGASLGATYGGTGGSIVPGAGNLLGGIGGGLIGGIIGYFAGETVTETVYDFIFTKGVSAK